MDLLIFGVLCLLSTACAFAAFTYMQRANDAQVACGRAVGKLNAMSGRVIALEGAVESLQRQHRKLSGAFYQSRNSDTPASPDVGLAPAEVRSPALRYCENWQLAMMGGPHCDAARCDCEYCNWKRAERNRVKADLLPAARAATLGASRAKE